MILSTGTNKDMFTEISTRTNDESLLMPNVVTRRLVILTTPNSILLC